VILYALLPSMDQSRRPMGNGGGELEADRRMRTMVRGYIRSSHPPYLATFFLLSSTHCPPSSAGLEVRQQSDPQLMDEDA